MMELLKLVEMVVVLLLILKMIQVKITMQEYKKIMVDLIFLAM